MTLNVVIIKAIRQLLDEGATYDDVMHRVQRVALRAIIDRNNGNQTAAAAEIGVHRNTLRIMMKGCNLDAAALRLLAQQESSTPNR